MPVTDLGNATDPFNPKPKVKKTPISNERLFAFADEYYRYMHEEAEWQDGVLVWEGSMSKWFIERGLRHLYSPVTKVLYSAGCINLASRGGGTKPSLVHLHHAPTLEEVTNLRENEFFFEKDAITRKGREMILEQMVNNHRKQIADLLERVERLENRLG